MQNEEQKKETKVLEHKPLTIIIPICCREGWDSCKHVPKKQKRAKQNVGL